ncbi:MAG: UDP-N-acetylmuramoyl-tripeptide--D-alanyl-D-alanine ligase [Clostridiales bacterium]|nr:UDP-N-acetylmuramoyl-tripeptide--D-alanyl-D-alanine ligase [Clostridiales bacterium]
MGIRTIITLILGVQALWLALRHNMHMLQLNVYINSEQRVWLKKNIKQQWLLIFAIVLGILNLLACGLKSSVFIIVTDILSWFTLILIILVYKALIRISNKKKLVFTPRVKRMIATNIVITFFIILVTFIIGGLPYIAGMVVVLVGGQIFLGMITNTVNHPLEVGVKNYYINDAKRIIKSNPNLTIIGVTGSYGKTSVKFYLQRLLQEHFNVLVTPESYNTPMGIVKTIRSSLRPTHEVFICEMGARYVGEIKEICDIVHPDHGLITSIGPQHLETFGGIDNVIKTKFELADAVPPGGMLFLNCDNEYIKEKEEEFKDRDIVCYYSDENNKEVCCGNDEICCNNGGYYAKDIKLSRFGTDFTAISPSGEQEAFNMKLIGGHNVINVMGAIAVANKLGVSLRSLRIAIRKLKPVPHRMEIKDHGKVTIIDDAFNSNPIGSKAAIETLALFDGIRILITPGMIELGDKEEEYNYKFGTYAAAACDYILLVGEKHTEPIREGALSAGFSENNCRVFAKVEDAISYAYAIRGQEHKYILLENDLPDNY